MSVRELLLAIVVFVALTALGIAFSLFYGGSQIGDLAFFRELPLTLSLGLFIFPLLIYVFDVLRFLIFARIFGVRLPVRTAITAVIATLFFAWITPGAVMGVPAAIFVLGRSNITWEQSFLICTAKSMTGLTLLLTTSLAILGLGYGPRLDGLYLYPIVLVTFGTMILFVGLPLLGSFYPKFTLRFLARLEKRSFFPKGVAFIRKSVGHLEQLASADKRLLGLSVVTHVLYFTAFMAPGALLSHHYGSSMRDGWLYSIVHKAFSFVAPTPGGSGLTEATSVPFYGDILPASKTLPVVLGFRFYTFHFQILFGFVYFLLNKQAYSLLGSRIPRSALERRR